MNRASPLTVFLAFLKLGLTSFGGPVAHIGYFREEFVARRRWLDDADFTDLVALCQFLPGPASSQVGIGLGAFQAGIPGAIAAWLGFTLPSAVLLILFALMVSQWGGATAGQWLHGLKVVAVAVVAQAVWTMARTLCPDRARGTLAILGAVLALAWSTAIGQLAAIAATGLLGLALDLTRPLPVREEHHAVPVSQGLGLALLGLFFLLLMGLPLLATGSGSVPLAMLDGFYRSGALIFGGGHVMLPLLKAELVTPGWIDLDLFLAGYGAAQAIPGPLSTFAAYLGTVMPGPGGWGWGVACLVAIFLPSFLLVLGVLPFWEGLRRQPRVQAALAGINAGVVGLLLAALYQPVWTGSIHDPGDFSLGLAAFGLLVLWQWPPWVVVALTALAGALFF